MPHPSRWAVLWRAVAKWWRNEPPPPPSLPEMGLVVEARKTLAGYTDMYAARIHTMPAYGQMAADHVDAKGIKRQPSLEGEVRLLAITLARVIGHLEEDIRRQHEVARLPQETSNPYSSS